MTTSSSSTTKTTQAAQTVELTVHDLNPAGDFYCPHPKADMKLWNSHPRVYIDVGHDGTGSCPYCGTQYLLKEGEVFAGGH